MKWPGRMTGEVLRHVARKPSTELYPLVPAVVPADFRGKIVFHPEACVGCKLCQKDCPSGALAIERLGDRRYQAVFALDRCIYCGQCADSCNRSCLEVTQDFELAVLDRAKLRVVFNEPEAPLPAVASGGSDAA